MNQRGSGIDWLLFVLLGFFWGSSYLFIKIGVDAGLAPFTLVAVRLMFGFVLLAGVVLIAREALPRRIGMYGHLLVMAVLSVALPFSLITWAEQSVDSTLAATLNASVPLFVIPIAAFALIDEKVTTNKVIGVVVGFIGVAVLVGFDPGVLAGTDVMAALALIGSSISYAAGGVYARRFAHGLRPMIPAVVQVGFALLMTASWRSSSSRRSLSRGASTRSWPWCGWGCWDRALPTWCSSGCWAAGARRGRHWSPTCCRSTASRWGRWCSASQSTRASCSARCW